MKPSLAEDAILDRVIFPCIVQPKIDGVRALNLNGTLTGRSLDPFPGYGVTEHFSRQEYVGFDGEMTLGSNPLGELLCSQTTGAMGRFKGVSFMADVHWWLFDLVRDDTIGLPYDERYQRLTELLSTMSSPRLHLVPSVCAFTPEELGIQIALNASMGYEGTIIRNPNALYKEGRATQKGQHLWRVKPWGDFEILVTGITEGQVNWNEKKTNSLGRSERSSAKAGMVPNGQVGSIQGTLVHDFVVDGRVLFPMGMEITAGSGKMTVAQAEDFFQHPDTLIGHYAKIKTMTYGVKDLPRFPTFESLRLKQDMS